MTNKTPNGMRKHHEGTKPRTCKMGKMFSSFGWASSILRQPLELVYTRIISIIYGAVNNTFTTCLSKHLLKQWLPVWEPLSQLKVQSSKFFSDQPSWANIIQQLTQNAHICCGCYVGIGNVPESSNMTSLHWKLGTG